VAPGAARRTAHIPRGHDIAVFHAGVNPVAQVPEGGAGRSVVRGIVAMIDVHENPPSMRCEAGKLAHRFHSGGVRKDVSQDIPKTNDYVEAALNRIQLFGAQRPERCGLGAETLHSYAGFQ